MSREHWLIPRTDVYAIHIESTADILHPVDIGSRTRRHSEDKRFIGRGQIQISDLSLTSFASRVMSFIDDQNAAIRQVENTPNDIVPNDLWRRDDKSTPAPHRLAFSRRNRTTHSHRFDALTRECFNQAIVMLLYQSHSWRYHQGPSIRAP
jgi:hypothetical protein